MNEGFYQVVSVNAPKGTVVNAAHPAAVVGGWELVVRLIETLFKAFSQLLPEAVPAGTKGMICHAGFGGSDPRTGDYYCYLETLAGGYGGRSGLDGPDAVQVHIQNTENAPIEETESNYPVQILRYGLVEDSDGPGQWRGGLGVRRDYLFLDHDPTFTVLADRVKQAPWGLFGGSPGATARYILNPDQEARALPSKGTVQLKAGDVVSYRTAGGGGYGPPEARDPELVREDVLLGKVSRTRAESRYRVAIDPVTGDVDPNETRRLRAAVETKV
jgi:N-methylhydantoinase B